MVRIKVLPLSEHVLANVPPATLRTRRLFGGEMSVDISRSSTHRLIYLEGERMVPEAALAASLVQQGKPAIDVGANIGYYLLLLKQAGASPVICVEPIAANLVDLRRVAEGLGNVEIVEAAVAARPGRLRMVTGMNGLVRADGDCDVDAVTLNQIAPVGTGFVKIDVEGYERSVLEGAHEMLERDRPNLFVEIHPPFVADPQDVSAIIEQLRQLYGRVEFYGNPLNDRGRLRVARRFGAHSPAHLAEPPDDIFWIAARG
jgi:FkbM family methyltransferase